MGWPILEAYWFYKTLSGWVLETIASSEPISEHYNKNNLTNNFTLQKDLKATVKALNLAVWYDLFIHKK